MIFIKWFEHFFLEKLTHFRVEDRMKFDTKNFSIIIGEGQ